MVFGRSTVSVKHGILAVVIVGLAFTSIGVLLLFLGQEMPSITIWLSMTLGGFILLIIGIHLLLASILTYAKIRRRHT